MERGQDSFFPIPNHCLILSMMLMHRASARSGREKCKAGRTTVSPPALRDVH
jgi:hypothetical protein